MAKKIKPDSSGKVIQKYMDEMRASGSKEATLTKERVILRRLDTLFKGNFNKVRKEDITKFILSWKEATESTKATRKMIIKKFFKWLGKEELVKDIKNKMPCTLLKSEEILTIEDINKLIESTDSHYYKALIAAMFETGARIGELKALKLKDFIETDKGLIVAIPTFKTNHPPRNVILPYSSQYLRNYFMYSGKGKDELVFPIGRSGVGQMLKRIKKKAGITKPAHCHSFRHSQATDMTKRGYNESIIRRKLGWANDSKMVANYTHLCDTDVIDATLQMAGTDIQKPVITNMKQAESLKLADASMQLSKLSEENETMKVKITELEQKSEKNQALNEDMIKAMIETRVKEILKNHKVPSSHS